MAILQKQLHDRYIYLYSIIFLGLNVNVNIPELMMTTDTIHVPLAISFFYKKCFE